MNIKILRNKKIYFGVSILFLTIFFIGLISLIFSKESKKEQSKQNLENILNMSPAEIDNFFTIIDREQKIAEREISQLLMLANINLRNKQFSEEINLINNISFLIDKIEVDPNKTEKQYAEEFANILNRLNLMNINLEDKQSLYNNGILVLNIANELANLKPHPNYLNIHKAEVLILGGIGYSLKELSTTEDNERALILIKTLNTLIENQKKIAENFK
ncbi:MAG: hypothetical protein KatS3mg095_0084 [Candidatus Parcubacteria bacterium]|nr:MAG: hypothetical protein KatS3mg095_0084 [Candidatus Parcubacteria bacterium]